MIIGIDGNEANVAQRLGVAEYAFELLLQFSILKPASKISKFVIYCRWSR